MDISKYRVPADKVRWTCDPEELPFTCTNEIRPPEVFIGQDRAVRAIEFGLGINAAGYNIFVSGLPGTGKSTVIRTHLEAAVAKRVKKEGEPELFDWCYVYNFESPDQPSALRLPQGMGSEVVADALGLLDRIMKDLPAAFGDETYTAQVRPINESSANLRRELITAVERNAAQQGFTVQSGPGGVAVVPVSEGKPMDQETYLKLTDKQRQELEATRIEVARQVEQAMDQIREAERQTIEQLAQLQHRIAENTINPYIGHVAGKYIAAGAQKTADFLRGLHDYALENAAAIINPGDGDNHPKPAPNMPRDPRLPFQVNLFVDNSKLTSPAIIMEDNPTYSRLFGYIDRRAMMGTYVTDHTMLRPGSLALANGGYIVIEARLALTHPAVWPTLKRVLKGGEVRPEDPEDITQGFLVPQQPLRPEAIPINVKVVFTGEPEVYQALAAYDLDFWEIVKVRADLNYQLDRTPENMRYYSEFVCGICNQYGLKHFSADGVAALIEHAVRIVDDQEKMTARFGLMVNLVREAAYWASKDKTEHAERRHVEKALEEREYRSSQTADAIQELMLHGTLIVDLEGAKVGQVNGLAVYSSGDFAFGKPSRITTQAYMGRDGFINIEREARLSGQSHDKGVLIMAGYLGAQFAQKFPLAVNISLAFEQSYGPVDGDSASSTELYSILSELSSVPVRQDIAVTGSVNQNGEIQPIGGANEKVEGFYDLCKAAGKLGKAGVLLPERNLRNLMLRPDVVEAIRKGKFHIYAARTVDEGIEVLTGVAAGKRNAQGNFPVRSVNGRAEARLKEFALGLRRFHGHS